MLAIWSKGAWNLAKLCKNPKVLVACLSTQNAGRPARRCSFLPGRYRGYFVDGMTTQTSSSQNATAHVLTWSRDKHKWFVEYKLVKSDSVGHHRLRTRHPDRFTSVEFSQPTATTDTVAKEGVEESISARISVPSFLSYYYSVSLIVSSFRIWHCLEVREKCIILTCYTTLSSINTLFRSPFVASHGIGISAYMTTCYVYDVCVWGLVYIQVR